MKYGSELITWSNTFSCGIKLIDDQHKGLVELVNNMFNHATGDAKQEHEYFNKVIQQATDYIKVHFATEEKIMRAVQYPGYTAHKRAHDSFVLEVLDNIRDYETEKYHTLFSFTKFLKNWVLSHIAVMDKQYFLYIKQMMTHNTSERVRTATAKIA
ncbi:MAG: bacteriohemerythrin [Treponema sp.]|jgi:hemerythrin|nr:bacteriohemerythrin [Treponema sp.]